MALGRESGVDPRDLRRKQPRRPCAGSDVLQHYPAWRSGAAAPAQAPSDVESSAAEARSGPGWRIRRIYLAGCSAGHLGPFGRVDARPASLALSGEVRADELGASY